MVTFTYHIYNKTIVRDTVVLENAKVIRKRLHLELDENSVHLVICQQGHTRQSSLEISRLLCNVIRSRCYVLDCCIAKLALSVGLMRVL